MRKVYTVNKAQIIISWDEANYLMGGSKVSGIKITASDGKLTVDSNIFDIDIIFVISDPEPPQPKVEASKSGFIPFLGTMGLIFIALGGYEIVAQCGEEIKDPGKNLPRAIFISIAVVMPIYLGCPSFRMQL